MDITKLTKPARKTLKLKKCGAVIVAAGSASRMKGIDKILTPLAGVPVLSRTLAAFQECDAVAEIVIVTRPDLILTVTDLSKDFPKVRAVVAGGKTRQESVAAGLGALSQDCGLAAIQDGARPLVTWQLIDRTVRAANTYGAAAPAIPVKDTIKTLKGGLVESTPDRAFLYAVQTPQVFDTDLLKAALHKAKTQCTAVTDDCSAVENLGRKVKIVEGEERNIKITTPLDLKIAEAILEESL